MDTEIHHEVQQFDLSIDGRINHRRILEPVAQRLVVEFDRQALVREATSLPVPVVDQVHAHPD